MRNHLHSSISFKFNSLGVLLNKSLWITNQLLKFCKLELNSFNNKILVKLTHVSRWTEAKDTLAGRKSFKRLHKGHLVKDLMKIQYHGKFPCNKNDCDRICSFSRESQTAHRKFVMFFLANMKSHCFLHKLVKTRHALFFTATYPTSILESRHQP